MRMTVEKFSAALQAAYVEGYVQGSMHPKRERVIPKAKELAWLFWRLVELKVITRRRAPRSEKQP